MISLTKDRDWRKYGYTLQHHTLTDTLKCELLSLGWEAHLRSERSEKKHMSGQEDEMGKEIDP